MAYAVTDDIKRQEKVFKSLSTYHANDADSIRGALTDGEIDATDKRVRFVTLQAYEQAGGKTRRDLFADEDDAGGIYVLDAGLLEELVAAKLETAAKALCEEGWNWVEVRSDFGWDAKSKFKQLREEPLPLSPELSAEHERLEDELDKLYDGDDGLTDEQSARADEITARIDEIEAVREFAWPEGSLEVAGAIVTPGNDGEADITRGLVRPEDVRKLSKAKTTPDGNDDGTAKQRTLKPGLPAKLLEQLTCHRTAAIAAELIDRPAIGLATIAYCFALELFGNGKTCVHVSLRRQLHDAVEGSAAFERIGQARARWADTIPGTPDDLWTWCLEQERDVLIDLLTFCAAMSVDAVVRKRGSMDSGTSLSHADDLALELGLDMTKWFTPSAENYFRHVSKAQILAALQETKGEIAPAWHKSKKNELASIAERQIAGTGWLPEILRTPDDSAQELKEAA
jgi:ParB family chromosome partitioning protein